MLPALLLSSLLPSSSFFILSVREGFLVRAAFVSQLKSESSEENRIDRLRSRRRFSRADEHADLPHRSLSFPDRLCFRNATPAPWVMTNRE